jgi:N-acetylmuramoyl-L-alanine amidase
VHVVLTRDDDSFVALEERTSRANDARGDLFISIHANAAPTGKPRGVETYFVSLEASDVSARAVADRENQALGASAPASAASDPLMALLGDMIATEHVEQSSAFAKLAQKELAAIRDGVPSRGVKQAPFVVLMGVQMPAALIEIGFVSNAHDEGKLRSSRYREKIAGALSQAVFHYGKRYDALRGLAAIQ